MQQQSAPFIFKIAMSLMLTDIIKNRDIRYRHIVKT